MNEFPDRIDPPLSSTFTDFRQRVFGIVLLGLAIPGFLFALISFILWLLHLAPTTGIFAGLGIQLIYLLAWYLDRRGHTLFASFLLPTSLFLIMCVATFFVGIGHGTIVGFVMAVALAGILLDLWIAICYAFLAVIAFLTLAYLQVSGLLISTYSPLDTIGADAAALLFGLVVIIVLNWINAQSLKRSFERQNEQSAVMKSNLLYASLVKGIPIGVYRNTQGPQGKFLMANPAFCSMLGYDSEAELLDILVSDLYENINERDTYLETLLRQGSVTGYPLELIRKDGRRIWASVTAKVVYKDDGKTISHLDGMVEDVTERILQERAIHSSENRYRRTINAMADGIHVVDENLNIMLMNQRFHEWLSDLGMESDAVGKRLQDVFPFLSKRALVEYETVFNDSVIINSDEGAITIGDQEFFTETRKIPIVENDRVTSVLTIVRDITSRKRDELALQESKAQLEETLAELEATQEHAIRQERLAAVGQLAAGMAHDFNNALMPITLYAEIMLKDSMLQPENSKRAKIILEQARQAAGLTQQILDFARKGLLRREIIDLTAFFGEIRQLLASALPENIVLNLSFGRDPVLIDGDPSRLYQAFLNLALNARDAMPEGGYFNIKIDQVQVNPGEEVPLEQMSPGSWIHIEVEDSGTGIDDEHLPRIFEPFFTTKEAGEGSGLGLAQVYGIIKQHDGYINVDSKVGEGTSFSIYFPAIPEAERNGPSTPDREAIDGGHESILLVEDDAITLQAISEILGMLNYQVYEAHTGEEAINIYKKSAIDLVLSDLVMPHMGGAELFTALQQIDPDVKMILLTGYPLGDEGKELLEKGIVAWVHKPLDMQTLSLLVQNALRQQPG